MGRGTDTRVGFVKRGDVHEYAIGPRVVRAVIVSAAQFAPSRIAMAPVAKVDPKGLTFGLAVPTGNGDPLVGSVDVGRLHPADPELIRAKVGRMSPTTMGRISLALKDFLELS